MITGFLSQGRAKLRVYCGNTAPSLSVSLSLSLSLAFVKSARALLLCARGFTVSCRRTFSGSAGVCHATEPLSTEMCKIVPAKLGYFMPNFPKLSDWQAVAERGRLVANLPPNLSMQE